MLPSFLLIIFILLAAWALVEMRRSSQTPTSGTATPDSEQLQNASWEIRTSMNTILGFVEILNTPSFGTLPEEHRHEIVGTIKRH